MSEKGKRDIDGVEVQELMAQINDALDKLPLENLLTVVETAKQKYETKQAEAKESLISEFQDRAQKMGLSLTDLFPAKTGKKEKEKNKKGDERAVKYRGPNGESWSGHGKPPKWIKALESEGHKREEFRVHETEVQS
jgi:DNA-binding protein H-NS